MVRIKLVLRVGLSLPIYVCFFVGTVSGVTLKAKPPATGNCSDTLAELLPQIRDNQSVYVPFKRFDNSQEEKIAFSNRQLAETMANGVTKAALEEVDKLLEEKGTFDIPLGVTGLSAASEVEEFRGGGMATRGWGRDNAFLFEFFITRAKRFEKIGEFEKARTYRAKALANAWGLLKQMSTQTQLYRIYKNIEFPAIHYTTQGAEAFPSVQFNIDKFEDALVPTNEGEWKGRNPWNNKQFDWFALSLIIPLRAIEEKLITYDDLQPEHKAFLISMLAMPTRLMFWQMHTSDAWEEGAEGRRTSTNMLQLKNLELFLRGRANPSHAASVFTRILKDMETSRTEWSYGVMPPEVQAIVRNTLISKNGEVSTAERALDNAYQIVYSQIDRGEAPDVYNGAPQARRYEDAAMSHPAMYLPERFSDQDILKIIRQMKKLERPEGIIRYEEDVYLHPFYWLGDKDELNPQFHRLPEKITGADLREKGFWPKNYQYLERIFGEDIEAQWSIHDSKMVQLYFALHQRTKNPSLKALSRSEIDRYILRAMGHVTGPNLIAMDGLPVGEWRISEAKLIVKVFRDANGAWLEKPETLYVPCPHMLYWSVAEFGIALDIARRMHEFPREHEGEDDASHRVSLSIVR